MKKVSNCIQQIYALPKIGLAAITLDCCYPTLDIGHGVRLLVSWHLRDFLIGHGLGSHPN
ncbi:MAG TPA: hypothetical protein VEJ16_17285 [Alphaproteobacteria bacterium]|nr:hypothetical protein [Alphaproteobacteria bacterium]